MAHVALVWLSKDASLMQAVTPLSSIDWILTIRHRRTLTYHESQSD